MPWIRFKFLFNTLFATVFGNIGAARRRCNAVLKQYFPRRQIILRERDQVFGVTLSPALQVGTLVIFALSGMWALTATTCYFYAQHKISAKRAQIATMEGSYQHLSEAVAAERNRTSEIAATLDYYRSYLLPLIDQTQALTENSGHANADPQIAATLKTNFQALKTELNIPPENTVATTDSDHLDLMVARAALTQRVTALETSLAGENQHRQLLEQNLLTAQHSVDTATAARDQMAKEIHVVTEHYASQAAEQEKTLGALAQHMRSTISTVEQVLAAAGMESQRIAPALRELNHSGGRGGKFVPFPGSAHDQPAGATPAQLAITIEEFDQLSEFLTAMPLASPLTSFAVTAPFGFRLDPFDHRPAMHEGIDLQAPRDSLVLATAAGKISFAGYKPDFGNIVEIDHGYNVTTRFAHLDRILVTPGAAVRVHQPIGLLGQTGRASGPHLHYEILVEGRPHDPRLFLEASNHVQEH